MRFAALTHFANVLEFPDNQCGRWHKFFPQPAPIYLELACGKGAYTINLARLFPQYNFIGVDIKGDRLFAGARQAEEEQLRNVCFVRCFIDHLDRFFAPGEVKEIWLPFPDPYLSSSKFQKRLTHPRFLSCYARLMNNQGAVHLKTDEVRLYEFTKKILQLHHIPIEKDLHYTADPSTHTDTDSRIYIPTDYERKNISGSHQTFYLRFTPHYPLAQHDKATLKKLLSEN